MRGLTTLYVDIETIPGAVPPAMIWPCDPDIANLKAPSNYKDEAKIEEWLKSAECRALETFDKGLQQAKENVEANWAAESINPLKGRILCIGAAINDEPVQVFCHDPVTPEAQRSTLDDFRYWLESSLGEMAMIKWVGFNVKGMDLRWIFQHSVKFRLTKLARLIPRERYSKMVEEIRDIWTGGEYGDRTRLSDIAEFLGLEGKSEGMDGSKVWPAYRAGKLSEIIEYCRRDVELTREIHKHLTGCF